MPNSVVRKFMMWWFDTPFSPWVCTNISVDFTAAQSYLDAVNKVSSSRVSVQHLICAAIAASLDRHRYANSRVVAGRIDHPEHVSIAIPVNLLGHRCGERRELGLTILAKAETLSLLELSQLSQKQLQVERSGKIENQFLQRILWIADRLPQSISSLLLSLIDFTLKRSWVWSRAQKAFPITAGLSNPGAVFDLEEGILLRANSVHLPQRLAAVGTFWGVTTVQDEVVVVKKQPAVRPMLPVMLVFDHRIMDGVRAGKMLMTFHSIIQNPADFFGAQGDSCIGDS